MIFIPRRAPEAKVTQLLFSAQPFCAFKAVTGRHFNSASRHANCAVGTTATPPSTRILPVDMSVIEGRIVIENGQLLTVHLESMLRKHRGIAAKLV